MPRMALENNSRMSLRIPAADKALLMRAAALQNTGLTDFVIRTGVQAARAGPGEEAVPHVGAEGSRERELLLRVAESDGAREPGKVVQGAVDAVLPTLLDCHHEEHRGVGQR